MKIYKTILVMAIGVQMAACAAAPKAPAQEPEPRFTATTIAHTSTPVPDDGEKRMEAVFINGLMVTYPDGALSSPEVEIDGSFPDGCTELDEITQSLEGNTIYIRLFTDRPEDAMCTMALTPFLVTVPLETGDLKAGEVYTVDVYGSQVEFEFGVMDEPVETGG